VEVYRCAVVSPGVCLASLLMALGCSGNAAERCRAAFSAADWSRAAMACREAYNTNQEAEMGVRLARAQFQLGEEDAALKTAETLFESVEGATAKQVAGLVYDRRGERVRAQVLLLEALQGHQALGQHNEAARDAHILSGSYWGELKFLEALETLDTCWTEAETANDTRMMGYSHMAMGDIFAQIGDEQVADWAYSQAILYFEDSLVDKAWLSLRRGLLHLEVGQFQLAEQTLRDTLVLAKEANLPEITLAAQLNLAYVRRDQGASDEAAQLFEQIEHEWAEKLTPSQLTTLWLNQGIIAKERGKLAEAEALFARSAANPTDGDWEWYISSHQGQLAVVQGDVVAAEAFYRKAIKLIEELRDASAIPELRSWVLASRRGPYTRLFALLARQGKGVEALALLESLQARAFWDVFLSRSGEFSLTPKAVILRAKALRDFLPVLQRVPSVPPQPIEALLQRLGPQEVLAYLEAEERVWVAIIQKGRVEIKDLGEAKALYKKIDAFIQKPSDSTLAASLGAALLPAGVGIASPAALYLVTSDKFAGIPFAALRRSGRFLIEDRPLIFVPSLRSLSPPAKGEPSWVVIGDPESNLPAARLEAQQVAQRLGAKAFLGTGATKASVLTAANASLLHFATHMNIGSAGGEIMLTDGPLTAQEVLSGGLKPAVTVLAGCASATSRQEGQWGSLPLAFLASGSQAVVATMRSVDDQATRKLMAGFYQYDWQRPAEALAIAQREMAKTRPAEEWAYFAVYGFLSTTQ
jgi:CHAT domain-containing protein/predicted negative regulator of RcsB-dependent stress response